MAKLIGIVGGSAAGKTLLAKELSSLIGPQVPILSQDNYYSDIGPLTSEERLAVNFDCPEAFDQERFIADLKLLRAGKPIRIPKYDFATCCRTGHTPPTPFGPYALVEGLFLLSVPLLREPFDHIYFIDCPEEVRIQRILRRDLNERGRTRETAWANIQNCVLPMHAKQIEPFKTHADRIFMNDRDDPSVLRDAALAIWREVQS